MKPASTTKNISKSDNIKSTYKNDKNLKRCFEKIENLNKCQLENEVQREKLEHACKQLTVWNEVFIVVGKQRYCK